MITSLTKAQTDKIKEYSEAYLAIGLSTEPCDRSKAEAAITEAYKYLKLDKPSFIWADNPYEGIVIAARIAAGKEEVTADEVVAQADKASFGSFEAYWVSFYAFVAEQLPCQHDNLIDIVKSIVQNCGVYWTFEDVVVMTEKPIAIKMKEEKLHNPEGLALEYKGGGWYIRPERSRLSFLARDDHQ